MKKYILKSDGHEPQIGEKISYTLNNDTTDATIRKYVSVPFSPDAIPMLLDDGIIEAQEVQSSHRPIIDFTDSPQEQEEEEEEKHEEEKKQKEEEKQENSIKSAESKSPSASTSSIKSSKSSKSSKSIKSSASIQSSKSIEYDEDSDGILDLLTSVLTNMTENIMILHSRQDALDKKLQILNSQVSGLKQSQEPIEPDMSIESILITTSF